MLQRRESVPLLPRHQPFESRVAFERREVGIDPEPPAREVVRDLQQRLQQVQGLLEFAHEEINPHQLVLVVGAAVGVATDGQERESPLTLSDRLRLPAQLSQGQAVEHMLLRIVRRGPKIFLEAEP